ncbi:TM2 domain-containing protein, partial [Mannheimia haemolytica]
MTEQPDKRPESTGDQSADKSADTSGTPLPPEFGSPFDYDAT